MGFGGGIKKTVLTFLEKFALDIKKRVLRTFEKPFLCVFSDGDPITRGGDAMFIEQVPGAKGQPHRTLAGGRHFIQEDLPVELSQAIIDFVRRAQGSSD